MRKFLICLLAVVLLGCLPVSADNGGIEDDWGDIEFEEPVVRGDANADGKLNTLDYVLVKRHVLRTFTLSEKGFRGADVTGDGKVTVDDATRLQSYLAEYSVPNVQKIKKCGDANRDGVIDIRDITAIQRYLADVENTTGIGEAI